MNTLRKIILHGLFSKLFTLQFPFYLTENPKSPGSIKELPEIIMRHKCTHVLIITDGGIMKLGLTRRLEKALKEAGIPYTIYDKTVANLLLSMSARRWSFTIKKAVMHHRFRRRFQYGLCKGCRCTRSKAKTNSGSDEGNPESTQETSTSYGSSYYCRYWK